MTWTSNSQLDESACKIHDTTNITLESKETKKIRFSILGMPITKSVPRHKPDQTTKQFTEDITHTKQNTSYEPLLSGDDIEFQFKIVYTADEVISNRNYYYREVVKAVNVIIMPSAMVTKWDVLPSESSDKNFLVLDITNCSQNEMDLTYADSKNLVIEPSDVCRIPLPIDR